MWVLKRAKHKRYESTRPTCSPFWLSLGLLYLSCSIASPAWAWVPLVLNGRCKQSGNACRATIGNAGSGSACCDPRNSNLSQCVANNPCQSNTPYRWADSALPVPWFFNPNGMPGQAGFKGHTAADLEAALKRAFDAWTTPSCTSMLHSYKGRSTRGPSQRDQVFVIYLATESEWAQAGLSNTGVLAYSIPVPDSNGLIRDADIVFSPQPVGKNWGLPKVGAQDLDFTDVAAHEIGHSIGFGHSEKSNALMHYAIRGLGPLFKGISNDEQQGVCFTYPQSRGCRQTRDCGTCRVCNAGTCEEVTPLQKKTCGLCRTDKDCGADSVCVITAEGKRCLQRCKTSGTTSCCPRDYACRTLNQNSVCVPTAGQCPRLKCAKDSDCGSDETCNLTTKQCEPKSDAPWQACKSRCTADKDCGTKNICHAFSSGRKQCVQPCLSGAFCPTGYTCRNVGKQALCLPTDEYFCPCLKSSHCGPGLSCRNQICQKPTGGKTLDPCNLKARCGPGLECLETEATRKQCFQICDNDPSIPPSGTPGGPCRLDRSCENGLDCRQVQNGPWLCLIPCKDDKACYLGGICNSLGQDGSYCMCSDVKQCKKDRVCYNSQGKAGNLTGACAYKGTRRSCPKGFVCSRFNTQTKICTPKPNGNIGDICDAYNLCRDGLRCIPSSNPNTSYCSEDCSRKGVCDFGGTCDYSGLYRYCQCSKDSDCPSRYGCRILRDGKGICACLAGDCKSCGNNKCERLIGEDCQNCPQDCGCAQNQRCINKVCAGFCGNNICDPNENCQDCPDCRCKKGWECSNKKCKPICGNGTCDTGEDCQNCQADCACKDGLACKNKTCQPFCGNGTCDKGEHCGNCDKDCACQGEKVCQKNVCVGTTTNPSCGDGRCDPKSEGCFTCPKDCACALPKQCRRNQCQAPIDCPDGTVQQKCDDQGKNCTDVCVEKEGCGCQNHPHDPSFSLLFLLALAMLARRRRLN